MMRFYKMTYWKKRICKHFVDDIFLCFIYKIGRSVAADVFHRCD